MICHFVLEKSCAAETNIISLFNRINDHLHIYICIQTWDLSIIQQYWIFWPKLLHIAMILITIKQCKYINIRHLGHFLIKFDWIIKFQQFQSKITFGVCKFCSSTCYSTEKSTQLEQILLDRRSGWPRQISTLPAYIIIHSVLKWAIKDNTPQ